MWVPGIEPGTFVRGASVLNHLTLEPQAPDFFVIVGGGGSSFKVNGIRLRPTELLFLKLFLVHRHIQRNIYSHYSASFSTVTYLVLLTLFR